jgi:hypothetical protein
MSVMAKQGEIYACSSCSRFNGFVYETIADFYFDYSNSRIRMGFTCFFFVEFLQSKRRLTGYASLVGHMQIQKDK